MFFNVFILLMEETPCSYIVNIETVRVDLKRSMLFIHYLCVKGTYELLIIPFLHALYKCKNDTFVCLCMFMNICICKHAFKLPMCTIFLSSGLWVSAPFFETDTRVSIVSVNYF